MAQNGRSVTLRAVNNLRAPHFDISVNLPDTHSQFLIDMMEEAAGIEPGFDRFVVRYHANQNGYFVLAINGAEATYQVDQTFWRILSGTQPINLGVSAYQPADGETVTFELVRHEGGQGAPGRDPCH